MKPSIKNTMPNNIEIELRDGEVVYSETGSYTTLPSDTIKKAEGVLQKIGVERVELINPKFTDGVPIFRLNEAPVKAKCHRQACQWSHPPTPLNNPPRESFGKGMTIEQSKASAMMEAIERYCGQRFPHSKIINASYKEVRDYTIHLSEFNFPSLPLKCENCPARNNECFQELLNVCQEWSWGYSLINKKLVLIPAALVYYPYISTSNISFMFNDTGGLSAGNTLGEAILQGIAEVIERDALYHAFNLGNLKDMPMLNINGTKNRYIQKFINRISPENIFAFHIKNENLKIGVSTVSAFICYSMRDGHHYFGGSGTSLDPEVALLRALTELEQQKVRQKALIKFDPNYLLAHNSIEPGKSISIMKIPNQSTGNIRSDIELYLNSLSKNNTDVIVVDLTQNEIKVPVVRVVIPKLISYSGSVIKESVLLDAIKKSNESLEIGHK
ncbi:MAG TPA: YcaO-like family protein [Atribacterota bacterium]|nr:YcaO-like family protein [Atribacterota bacterium]